MTKNMHEDILSVLINEALETPEEGWLSDLASYGLEYDAANQSITLDEVFGSIDVGHLAGIVTDLVINYEH